MAATPEKISAKSVAAPKVGAPSRKRRRGPIPLADLYILRQVVEETMRGLGWFAGLFIAFSVVASTRKLASDGVPLSLAFEVLALQTPRIILFTLPASLLFGTVQTFVEMSSRGEITALWAGGMSLKRMLRGPLVFALFLGIFAFWLQEVVVPGAELRKSALMATGITKIGKQTNFKIADLKPDGSYERILQAQSFDPLKRELINPVIQIFRADNTVKLQIKAKRAEWDLEAGHWTFFNGETTSQTPNGPGGTFDVPTAFNELSVQAKMAPSLQKLKNSQKSFAQQLKDHNYEMVSIRDLMSYRAELEKQLPAQTGAIRAVTQKEIRSATYGLHDKFATPLLCLAIVLIGAPLGIRPQRSASSGLGLGLSLMVLVAYYVVWTLAATFGKNGESFPLFWAYLASGVVGLIGAVLVWRKN